LYVASGESFGAAPASLPPQHALVTDVRATNAKAQRRRRR
jgi:hypothetical protein